MGATSHSDVTVTSTGDGQVLIRDTVWKNKTLSGDITIDKDGVVTLSSTVSDTTLTDSIFNRAIISGLRLSTVTITANYAATYDNAIILVNPFSYEYLTITLPDVTDLEGLTLYIKNIGIGTAIITGFGSETIDGKDNIYIPKRYNACTVLCNGINWYII